MGKVSGVEWCGPTWNPWHGCHKISPGCKLCYMYREKRRYGGQQPNVVVRSKTTFNDPLKWARAVEQGRASLEDFEDIFTCSWSDFFIAEADEWRAEAWSIMRNTPFRYLIVTKRAERIRQCLPPDWGEGYPNVLLIVSCENADYAWRIMTLQQVPCIGGRGVSIEPLLEGFSIRRFLEDYNTSERISHIMPSTFFPKLDWVIVGGESGDPDEKVRPMHPDWVRTIRDECVETSTPLFFKQWGEWAPWEDGMHGQVAWIDSARSILEQRVAQVNVPAPVLAAWCSAEVGCATQVPMVRIGRKASGRILDGREWSEKPPRRDVPKVATQEMFA